MRLNTRQHVATASIHLAVLSMTTFPAHGQIMERVSHRYRVEPTVARNLAPFGVESIVVMLGTGTPAPDPHRFGPATAIVVNGQPYIVDAGEGVMRALAKAAAIHSGRVAAAFDPTRLTRVFITHYHVDHTVGLPSLLLLAWQLGRTEPIEVYGPQGIKHLVSNVIEAWSPNIKKRLSQSNPKSVTGWKATIRETTTKSSELIYKDDNVAVEAFYHDHANLDHNYAYRITAQDRVFVVMGDGKADDRLIEAAKNADVFIAEIATRADAGRARWAGATPEERVRTVSEFHIMPDELAEIVTKANVKTLVLYHTNNYSDPFDPEALLKEMRQYYSGRVELARDGDIF